MHTIRFYRSTYASFCKDLHLSRIQHIACIWSLIFIPWKLKYTKIYRRQEVHILKQFLQCWLSLHHTGRKVCLFTTPIDYNFWQHVVKITIFSILTINMSVIYTYLIQWEQGWDTAEKAFLSLKVAGFDFALTMRLHHWPFIVSFLSKHNAMVSRRNNHQWDHWQ